MKCSICDERVCTHQWKSTTKWSDRAKAAEQRCLDLEANLTEARQTAVTLWEEGAETGYGARIERYREELANG